MIDVEATERFMSAPWLPELDPETKMAILGALVEARRRPEPPCWSRISPTITCRS